MDQRFARSYEYAIVIVCSLVLAGCDAMYNTPGIGPTIRTAVGPKGMCDPILRIPIDIDARGNECKFEFTLKYIGQYVMCFAPRHQDRDRLPIRELGEKNTTPLVLEITFQQDNRSPLTYRVADADFSAWPPLDGMHIVWFRCPENLVRKKPVTCTIRVLEPDAKMQEDHGPFDVTVTELSDY